MVPPGASLLGQNNVQGNYSPAIGFTLDQDFMPAIQARGAANGDGSTQLSWGPVAEEGVVAADQLQAMQQEVGTGLLVERASRLRISKSAIAFRGQAR